MDSYQQQINASKGEDYTSVMNILIRYGETHKAFNEIRNNLGIKEITASNLEEWLLENEKYASKEDVDKLNKLRNKN